MRSAVTALLLLSLTVAACAQGAPSQAEDRGGDELWRTATLRDVVTGADFTIGGLKGKVVAIEMMAIWCVNCRVQQGEAQQALAQLGSSEIVYVSLDVDPNERAADLAAYARREGFGWLFVVASPEVSRSLAATFGAQILSPPATPLIVLGPDGQVVEQHIGIKGADELAALFAEHLP